MQRSQEKAVYDEVEVDDDAVDHETFTAITSRPTTLVVPPDVSYDFVCFYGSSEILQLWVSDDPEDAGMALVLVLDEARKDRDYCQRLIKRNKRLESSIVLMQTAKEAAEKELAGARRQIAELLAAAKAEKSG